MSISEIQPKPKREIALIYLAPFPAAPTVADQYYILRDYAYDRDYAVIVQEMDLPISVGSWLTGVYGPILDYVDLILYMRGQRVEEFRNLSKLPGIRYRASTPDDPNWMPVEPIRIPV